MVPSLSRSGMVEGVMLIYDFLGYGVFLTLGAVEYKSYSIVDRRICDSLFTTTGINHQQHHYSKCPVCLGQRKILHHEDDSHTFYPCGICFERGWVRR